MQPTSDERREVAAKLRKLPSDPCADIKKWQAGGLFIDMNLSDEADYSQIHNAVCGCFPAEYMHPGDYEELHERLADLIDRPTCELVEVWDGEAKQHYLDCTACHFGRLAIELDDAGVRFNSRALWTGVDYTSLTHCPYCGAEVER